jgi:Putative transposase
LHREGLGIHWEYRRKLVHVNCEGISIDGDDFTREESIAHQGRALGIASKLKVTLRAVRTVGQVIANLMLEFVLLSEFQWCPDIVTFSGLSGVLYGFASVFEKDFQRSLMATSSTHSKKLGPMARTAVVFSPLEFMEKPSSLVPPPRVHLTRFHGIFAPHSKHRDPYRVHLSLHEVRVPQVGRVVESGSSSP